MSQLIVQKYGGMCLATPDKVKSVASKIAQRTRQGHKLLVIVSAMGKTTDDLVKLAYQVSDRPARRELDMLLTTGERISMSLLTMALNDLGVPAISLTGSQAGVMTDGSHSNAKIIDVRPTRLQEELKRKDVVIIAGFQGVDPQTKEITTLGRGGSDTTAVAIAAHFKADACEIIKEVDGLCSADPKLVKSAKVYSLMTHKSLLEMCFWGAKVLHYRSVELAQLRNVPLSLRFADDHDRGTQVKSEVNVFEEQQILAVNFHQEIHHLEVSSVATMSDGWQQVEQCLKRNGLAWPQILAAAMDASGLRFMYTSDFEHLAAIGNAVKGEKQIRPHRAPLSSVTLTCHGAVASDLVARSTFHLKAKGIVVDKLLQSPLSVTFVVDQKDRERAVQVLHDLI